MKIRPLGVALLHADKRSGEERPDMTWLITSSRS